MFRAAVFATSGMMKSKPFFKNNHPVLQKEV